MITYQDWLNLDDNQVSGVVGTNVSTAVIYLNGTRRWFLTQSDNWDDYPRLACDAQKNLNQLFYDHGIRTLIQPVLGYDLLSRGSEYMAMCIDNGLGLLTQSDCRAWFQAQQVRVSFYGNWVDTLCEAGYHKMVTAMQDVVDETAHHTKNKLLLGVFADDGLDGIVNLAKTVNSGERLLSQYYGQSVDPVDLVIGSGQPVIWDVPLLDINKASLYFMQAPTFCLNRTKLREILYDILFERVNDDDLITDLSESDWRNYDILGVGQQTSRGWVAHQGALTQ